MKTCPICNSLCFDDMPVCYGCMHGFERDESHGRPLAGPTPLSAEAAGAAASAQAGAVSEGDRMGGNAAEKGKPSGGVGEEGPIDAPGAHGGEDVLGAGGSGDTLISAPSFTIEAPEGYRVTLRLERA